MLDKAIAARGYALVLGVLPVMHDRDVAAVLRRWEPGRRIERSRVPEIAVALCPALVAAALDAGAADAVAHPVDPFELAARVDVRIRTHLPGNLRIGDLAIDPVHRRVTRAGQSIPLVAREYALLLYLAERRGEYVTRCELLECVWKLRFDPGTNVVAVHMSKLRAKIERAFDGRMIHSIKGLGYCLDAV